VIMNRRGGLKLSSCRSLVYCLIGVQLTKGSMLERSSVFPVFLYFVSVLLILICLAFFY
jgi:hypothetical protein